MINAKHHKFWRILRFLGENLKWRIDASKNDAPLNDLLVQKYRFRHRIYQNNCNDILIFKIFLQFKRDT